MAQVPRKNDSNVPDNITHDARVLSECVLLWGMHANRLVAHNWQCCVNCGLNLAAEKPILSLYAHNNHIHTFSSCAQRLHDPTQAV